MTVPFFPAYDLEASFGKAMREVFRDVSAFKVNKPSFTVDAGATSIVFPEVGVDWRSVTYTGNTETGKIVVFAPEGLVARIDFVHPQPEITVEPYIRFSTYVVSDPREVSFDIMKYYGNPLDANQQDRTIPVAVTMLTNFDIQRRAAYGESAEVYGTLCVYSSAATGGLQTLKTEAKKFYEAQKTSRPAFGVLGIKNLWLDPPRYMYYEEQGACNECQMDFSALIQIS